MKITGIRIIDDFGTSLIKVYNHSLYWKMREIVVEPHSRFPKIIKCIFLVLLKIMDEYHCAFIGTGIGYGAHFDGPPRLPHGLNGIVIHEKTRFGKNCTILQQVTFGGTVRNGVPVAPVCGDNCLFGAGAKILVVSRFFRKFISSASKYRNQIYGFSSSFGCSISILNRCSMSI